MFPFIKKYFNQIFKAIDFTMKYEKKFKAKVRTVSKYQEVDTSTPKLTLFRINPIQDSKIVTMFIKPILKDSRKVRRIRNYVSKFNLYLYFLL